MKKLIIFLAGYSPRLVVLAIFSSVLSGLLNTSLIALVHQTTSSSTQPPAIMMWAFLALCVLLPVTRIGSALVVSYMIQKVIYNLRFHLCKQVLRAPLRKLEKHGPSKVLSSLTQDTLNLAQALSQLPFGAMSLALVSGCLGYLFWLYWPAAVGILIASVFGVLFFHLLAEKGRRAFERARTERDHLFKHFEAITLGNKEFKMHHKRRSSFLDKIFHRTAHAMQVQNIRATFHYSSAISIGNIFFFIAIAIAVFVLPSYSPEIRTGNALAGYALILIFMIGPLDGLANMIPVFSNARIALEKVEALGFSLDGAKQETQCERDPEPTWQSLRLEGVTHSYHREKEDQLFKMGPIDLEFRPGELVFLVGGNGSGKTTLAKLITGLYFPESGTLSWNGETINEDNRDEFRQYFTTVFSDFYLFENMIGLESTEDLEGKIKAYLEKLQLQHKVVFEDGQLSTVDLSQGQRKRLALLTAYLEDRPIYLFDEWAADQDPYFKKIFYEILLPELKARGKTLIVISHDDHYYSQADRIIKLDYGQVEFDRPTDQLDMAPGGFLSAPTS